MNGNRNVKVVHGDFQTSERLSYDICRFLKTEFDFKPQYILEPSCGIGNFINAAHDVFLPAYSYGIEINEEYADLASSRIEKNATIYNADFFNFNLDELSKIFQNQTTLIIGNPPWVNNSVLSSLNSTNTPVKSNIKHLKGLDALTGSSNFDICEFFFLKLIEAFKYTDTTIALLCKTTVARNVFIELRKRSITYKFCKMYTIDTKKEFNVSVDSCLFILDLNKSEHTVEECAVYDFYSSHEVISRFGYTNEKFYSSLSQQPIDIDGSSCFEWRQGIKHDCSKVMELTKYDDAYINGFNESIAIEDEYIYPLVKSSHIKQPIITSFKKYVIVTQKKINDDTACIASRAKNTWLYLHAKIEFFRKRKSVIYKNSPDFSMFGVGDYSYKKYKVAISGFYKKPLFALVYGEKSAMLDDTCYFLAFDAYNDAYTAMLILNSQIVNDFLLRISFIDAKRPYTKKILGRIDFEKISTRIAIEDLVEVEKSLSLSKYIKIKHYEEFKKMIRGTRENFLLLF